MDNIQLLVELQDRSNFAAKQFPYTFLHLRSSRDQMLDVH